MLQQSKIASLKTRKRPSIVSVWTKGERKVKHRLEIVDLDEFASSWKVWYVDNMPRWWSACGKKIEDLSFDVPGAERWEDLTKGGKNGLALFVVSLQWWNLATLPANAFHHLQFCYAVRDVAWVFQQIRSSLESNSGPRRVRPSSRLGESASFLRSRSGNAAQPQVNSPQPPRPRKRATRQCH